MQAAATLRANQRAFLSASRAADVRIDEVVKSSIGCTFSSHQTGRYVEFVIGHVSQLLVRAELFSRYLLSPGGEATIRRAKTGAQTAESFIRDGVVLVRPLDLVDESRTHAGIDSIHNCIANLRGYLERFPPGLLSEVMFDQQYSPIFVDIKPYPWLVSHEPIFDDDDTSPIYWNGCLSGTPYSGPHDLARLEELTTESVLFIGSRPLLSHFVTYALRRGVQAIYA
jgi:hypothetical protein